MRWVVTQTYEAQQKWLSWNRELVECKPLPHICSTRLTPLPLGSAATSAAASAVSPGAAASAPSSSRWGLKYIARLIIQLIYF
jgi:hypothetical protein